MSRLLSWAGRLPPGLHHTLKSLPGSWRIRRLITGKPRLPGPAPGERRAVVYLPTWARWDIMRQRPQGILAAFAGAGFPVYFIDPREDSPRRAGGVEIVPSIRHVPSSGVILYVHFAPLRQLFRLFEDAVVVYDILDDLSIYDPDEVGLPMKRRVAAHHPYLVAFAEVVMASNQVLAERHGHERPDLILVENGVDAERFAKPAARPGDLPEGRPLIGYHGAVAPWLDFDLISAVARARPEWGIVLVGPVDPRCADRAEPLRGLSNVTLLGERHPDAMPGYVQAFDVGIIPFVVGHMTSGVTPLKMYEYLAAGKPCVATPLPAVLAQPAVVTASTVHEFVEAIERALTASGEEQRRAAGRAADWSVRLEPVLDRMAAEGLDRANS